MTDEQIAKFILHRAKANAVPLKLYNPKLVIWHDSYSDFLAIKFSNDDRPFIVRFCHGTKRGLFKLKLHSEEFIKWQKQKLNEHKCTAFAVDYDLPAMPSCIKHFVSYAIIEALKTRGMGFDLFSFAFPNDISLIDPTETYEEVAIETDLLGFEMDELTGL